MPKKKRRLELVPKEGTLERALRDASEFTKLTGIVAVARSEGDARGWRAVASMALDAGWRGTYGTTKED